MVALFLCLFDALLCDYNPSFVCCAEARMGEATRMREKYPDRIPVRIIFFFYLNLVYH